MLARVIFTIVDFRARKGLASAPGETITHKERARQTGVRGETYAYWYLRRQGYLLIARNYAFPGIQGEIDMAGYDRGVLAFVEVKTRSASVPGQPSPEDAVNWEKRRNLARMAHQFLRARRIESTPFRFDVLAIETQPGKPPQVRLHKGAFTPAA